MSGRPGTSQLHRISALRASSAIAAGTPRAKSPPPRFSAFHPAHVVASQSLEPCTKSYRAPAQAHISQPIVAQVAHIAHTSNRPRQPPALHHTFLPTCRSDSRPSTPKLTRCWGAGACKAQQNRTEQNRQKLKNRKNIQEQTKPYLQNKQLILACGSRARQRLPADGQKCDMESQVGHIAINRPDKAHQSLIYYARAHTHARSAKMTKNMAVLRSL